MAIASSVLDLPDAVAPPVARHSTPLRILYLMDELHWGNTNAGTEGQFLQLVKHLDRDRFEPHLAVFRTTPYIDAGKDLPCPTRVLAIHKLLHPRALLTLGRLSHVVRAGGFRLAHVFLNDASIAAPFFCRLGGAQVLVSRRDMGFWYTKGVLGALRMSNVFVSRVVTNSDAVRRNVHSREGFPLAKIEVCFNGHDPARFDAPALPGFRERFNIGASDPVIGMVANFNPWKRHVDLVQAFALVRRRHPSAHLVFAGAGNTEPARAVATALGVAAAVHFLGTVPDAVPVVKHFTVGVLCSESEGLSNAVIEYMGCGKPTVCTSAGGNAEAVRDGQSGFLVEPFAVDALADRITRLLASSALREQMGRCARESAQRFTIRRMADAHMTLYERLTGRHPDA